MQPNSVNHYVINLSNFILFVMSRIISKRSLCMGRKRRNRWNLKCTTKVWQRLNSATNGNKLEHAHTEITVSLLMALRNFAQSYAIHATKQKSVEWCLLVTLAHMATAVISAMLWLRRRNSWAAASTIKYRFISCWVRIFIVATESEQLSF